MEPQLATEIRAAYENHDREVTIANFKVASILGMVLMPAGALLDYMVYPDEVWHFLELRLLCSSLIGLFLAFLLTPVGRHLYRVCGLTLLMLPTLFISVMIYETEGTRSPYYAGLNLVVLMLGFVLHWRFWESLMAVATVLGMYLTACLLHGDPRDPGIFFNNLYFLTLTGIIVVTGSYILSELRFRDFAGRFELDRSRQQLQENNRKLMELDTLKSRFFANISHELRTPLTLMLGPLEDLMRHPRMTADEPLQQSLATMRANGMRLLKLINDLLELVRLDAGVIPVKQEPVELAGFIKGLADAARHLAEKKQLTLQTSVAPDIGWVMVDRDKLEKIVLNLQFNALKFTPPGGQVALQAGREGQELIIQVRDTGQGIAAKDLPNVFTRFWQADSSSRRKYQGVGIGLALVKELTEVQGGTVAVASQEGKGTTFTLRLPYLPATASAGAAPVEGRADGLLSTPASQEWLSSLYHQAELQTDTGLASADPISAAADARNLPLVLVVDDEPELRRFLRGQLENHYQVHEAADGRQAVEAATRLLPDLILLDMMMPEKDGLEVCRELRQQEATRNLPIILLTAHADEETKLSALKDGARDFLPKPFSTAELHLRVKNLVEASRHEKQLARQKERVERAIEQLKEAESQLVQSEKLAALGRMSAGIIHEINNPLNYAKTGLYTLRQRLVDLPAESRQAVEALLAEIEDGVNRVRNIVLDLGPFARDRDALCDEIEVNQAVELALRFLSHEYQDSVRVEKDLAPGLTAWVNRVRFVQVLVNLLQNSLDALKQQPPGGEEPVIAIKGWRDGNRCKLTVRDNGPGIAADVQPKIFEPFFTTKEVGAGIGLGLHICHRIMQKHDGSITVNSAPGVFCEFTLDLPATEPPPETA